MATPSDFADLIQGYLKKLDDQNKNVASTEKMDTLTKKLTLSTSGSGSETAVTQFNDLENVNAEFTIKRMKSTDDTKANEVTYDITVRLSTGNGSDSSRVILSLTGKVKQTGQSVTTTMMVALKLPRMNTPGKQKTFFTVTQNVLWEIHNERIRIKIKKETAK